MRRPVRLNMITADRGQSWHSTIVWLLLGLCLMAWASGAPGTSPALADDSDELFSPFNVVARVTPPPDTATALRYGTGGPVDRQAAYQELLRTAVLSIKQGYYATAITLLEPYHWNDDFLTLHALGVAYVRTARNQEAYDVLLRAHALRPGAAAPLLPAALACARIARRCDDYRRLALEYKALGGKFTRFADKIANHLPFTLNFTRRS